MSVPFDLNSNGSWVLQKQVIEWITGPTEGLSVIDLCCGEMSLTRQMKFKESVHVDVIDEPKRPKEFKFVKMDVLSNGEVYDRKYDVAICLDGIEHLKKDDGYRLADLMERISKVSVIFTPLGEYLLEPESLTPYSHKSGWIPEDLPTWHSLVFPKWHPTLNCGAVFFWRKS